MYSIRFDGVIVNWRSGRPRRMWESIQGPKLYYRAARGYKANQNQQFQRGEEAVALNGD